MTHRNVRGRSIVSLYSLYERFIFSACKASSSIAMVFIEIMISLIYLTLYFVLHAVSTPVVPISKSTFSVDKPPSAPTSEGLNSVILQQNHTQTNNRSGEHQSLLRKLQYFPVAFIPLSLPPGGGSKCSCRYLHSVLYCGRRA